MELTWIDAIWSDDSVVIKFIDAINVPPNDCPTVVILFILSPISETNENIYVWLTPEANDINTNDIIQKVYLLTLFISDIHIMGVIIIDILIINWLIINGKVYCSLS